MVLRSAIFFFALAATLAADEADKDWPFYTPANVSVPTVGDAEWGRNQIDAFVLAGLESKQLRPAPVASKQTLIRRLYLDLIGLPPSSQEVDAFLRDAEADAYEKLVDRLLDDSRYGERWARYWLDLARYADTAGYEGDPDLPHAWRYRDYVIDSLNQDKPYDLFVREQIAGDEFHQVMGAGDLPDTPAERVVALTFLRLAPFTEPRGDETRHEMLSEMTSTVGSVFLGLTVGCAKCHDHKHDSIPTEDFYRMQAFFATIQIPRPERGDIYQIGGPLPAKFYRDGEEEWAARQRTKIQNDLDQAKAELSRLKKQLEERLGGGAGFGMQSLTKATGNDYYFAQQSVNDGQMHFSVVNAVDGNWQIFTDDVGPATLGSLSGSNKGRWINDIPNVRHVSLGRHTEGKGAVAGAGHHGSFAEILIYDHPLSPQERSSLAAYVRVKYDGAEPAVGSPPDSGLRFWLDASDLDANPATANPDGGVRVACWTDKVSGIRLTQDEGELQPKLARLGETGAAAVQFEADLLLGDAASASFLGDVQGSIVAVYSATHAHEGYGLEIGGGGEFISTVIYPNANQGSIDDILRNANSDQITQGERQRYEYLSTRDRFVSQQLKRLQPHAMSLRHSYGPPYEPGVPTSRVMNRGEYDNPGEVVQPGFLSCITGHQDPAPIRLDPFKRWPTRSRRMALADWIVAPNNPMTARVMVNRLWYWHFGQGLVRTPSDFGYLSDGPSHRELLDWLSLRFIEKGWSIKAMHRLIVNSSAYRQSSMIDDPRAREVDPDNRLLWRFNRQRLSAEAVRDSVLWVSGRLNPEQYGLPIFPPLPDGIQDRVKYSESKWDTQHGAEGRKRSLYIYQQRTLTMPLMQTFDSLVCDESRPRRRASVTPLQALAMYNGELVNEEAKHFAARVRTLVGDDPDEQIECAFRLALCRPPTEDETVRMRRLMESCESTHESLVGVCRVLYNTSEFVYVD